MNDYIKKIKELTKIDQARIGYICSSVDEKGNYLNYILTIDNFVSWNEKLINYLIDNKKITIKECKNLLEDDIFNIYKTKVSVERIPKILLNLMVVNEILTVESFNSFSLRRKYKQMYSNYIEKHKN